MRTREGPNVRGGGRSVSRSLREGFLFAIGVGVVAEEDFLQAGLARGAKVVQASHPHQLAVSKNSHRVADVLDFGQDVRGEEHRSAAIARLSKQLVELLLIQRVETIGPLVEDQNVGLVHERGQDAELSLVAARVFTEPPVEGAVESLR